MTISATSGITGMSLPVVSRKTENPADDFQKIMDKALDTQHGNVPSNTRVDERSAPAALNVSMSQVDLQQTTV